jgi:YggT family protein
MCAQANPLLTVVCLAASIYAFILLIWVIVSWIQFAGWRPPVSGPARQAIDLLDRIVQPVVTPLRRIVPPAGMFDLSVLVAFIILFVIRQATCR